MTTSIRSGTSDAGILVNGVERVTIDSTGITLGIPDNSITPAKLTQKLTSGTAVASTSGTSIDFTGIPTWAKRITVMIAGVSLSGSASPRIQLGDAGGIETSGYVGSNGLVVSGSGAAATFSSGFDFSGSLASNIYHGSITITLQDTSNTWVANGLLGFSTAAVTILGGYKQTSATLDRIRLTSTNGTDTFDAGSVNIMWE